MPPLIIGILLATRAAASIASRLLLPVLLARWSRAGLVVVSLAGAGTTLALVPWLFELSWVAAALLAVGGFFLGLGQPITIALVAQAVPPDSRGAALALRLLGNKVGQVGLPAAAGLLAAPVGPSGALWMSCAMLAAACVRWPGNRGARLNSCGQRTARTLDDRIAPSALFSTSLRRSTAPAVVDLTGEGGQRLGGEIPGRAVPMA